jgi:hypothetical protein
MAKSKKMGLWQQYYGCIFSEWDRFLHPIRFSGGDGLAMK